MSLISNYGVETIKQSLERRLWQHAELTVDGHIFYTGMLKVCGHGSIRYGNTMIGAHVASAMLYLSNYNSKLSVLHKPECNIPKCFAPGHIYQGTQSDNVRDMVIVGTHNQARKTHCPKGHEFTVKNTRLYKGSRVCRECDRIRSLFK